MNINIEDHRPLITILLIARSNMYLISQTLESLIEQTYKDFEILILEENASRRDIQTIRSYSSHIKKIHSFSDTSLSNMINEGITFARGKYINILFPGDVYLSQYGLESLQKKIEKDESLDLIYSAFLLRDGYAIPRVIQRDFNVMTLKKGQMPTRLSSCLFSKHILKKIEGVDSRYKYRFGFDLFCRILKKDNIKTCFIPQVMVDYEFFVKAPLEILEYAKETFIIIYRNFGFVKGMRWWLFHDSFNLVKWWLRAVTKLFAEI
jgi:glycosyltransferase involved in cell wall biosynthesis